jgi:hypothetical protein
LQNEKEFKIFKDGELINKPKKVKEVASVYFKISHKTQGEIMGNIDQVKKVDEIISTIHRFRPEVLRDTYDTELLKTCTFIPFFDRVKP